MRRVLTRTVCIFSTLVGLLGGSVIAEKSSMATARMSLFEALRTVHTAKENVIFVEAVAKGVPVTMPSNTQHSNTSQVAKLHGMHTTPVRGILVLEEMVPERENSMDRLNTAADWAAAHGAAAADLRSYSDTVTRSAHVVTDGMQSGLFSFSQLSPERVEAALDVAGRAGDLRAVWALAYLIDSTTQTSSNPRNPDSTKH